MLNPNSSRSSADNSWAKASVFPTSNLQVSFHQKLIRRFFASYITSREISEIGSHFSFVLLKKIRI
jgi:hypothetical protein